MHIAKGRQHPQHQSGAIVKARQSVHNTDVAYILPTIMPRASAVIITSEHIRPVALMHKEEEEEEENMTPIISA